MQQLTALEKQLASAAEFELLDDDAKAALEELSHADRNYLYDLRAPHSQHVRTNPVALLVAAVHELCPTAVVEAFFDDTSCALTVSRTATNLVRVAGFTRTGQVADKAKATDYDGGTVASVSAAKFDPSTLAETIVNTLGG